MMNNDTTLDAALFTLSREASEDAYLIWGLFITLAILLHMLWTVWKVVTILREVRELRELVLRHRKE
jgi:hypothetical protein